MSLVLELLAQRGIVTAEEQARFLEPDFERDCFDPFLMKGMELAVERLSQALETKQKVIVFGDYDADGVPATALLVRCLGYLGLMVIPRIPTRVAGYGLTEEVVAELIAEKPDLLITVDNGTVAQTEIAALAQAGIDVIVCDHHEPQEGRLAHAALAILNPKQVGCEYPEKELCGCAIAWKLMQALYIHLGEETARLRWELDLVAFSTIADMVPLLGENHTLAYFGLKVLRKSRNRGLQALAKAAEVDILLSSASIIGFRLAPRINAPSRMHQEVYEGRNAALTLLVTADLAESQSLAHYLNEQNTERQRLVEEQLQEAEILLSDQLSNLCLVVYKQEWSTGVIGLLAGRLLERYKRPVIVLANEGEQIKGSVRSVEGVNAVVLLQSVEIQMARFGGHAKAAGLTLGENVTPAIFNQEIQVAMSQFSLDLEGLAAATSLRADLVIKLSEVNTELIRELESIEPFGIGFPSPLFSSICQVQKVRPMGNQGQHFSCQLVDGSVSKKAVAFALSGQFPKEGKTYKVLYVAEEEEWQGVKTIRCRIKNLLKWENG